MFRILLFTSFNGNLYAFVDTLSVTLPTFVIEIITSLPFKWSFRAIQCVTRDMLEHGSSIAFMLPPGDSTVFSINRVCAFDDRRFWEW